MKITKAERGTALFDRHGNAWLRLDSGAMSHIKSDDWLGNSPSNARFIAWNEEDLPGIEVTNGPFHRPMIGLLITWSRDMRRETR